MGKIWLMLLVSGLSISGCAAVEPILAPTFTNSELALELEKIDMPSEEIDRGLLIKFPVIVLFDYDKAVLKNEARVIIQRVATVLNHPRALIRPISIDGHSDARGNADYNLKLSELRAGIVAEEFLFSGIGKERIAAVLGWGETRPAASNKNEDGTDNPEGRSKNRRVELIILEEN